MPTNLQNHATTSAKAKVKTISIERILADRLQELCIDSGNLPRHVSAHLRAIVDDESKRILDALAAKVAALEAQTGEQLRNQIARLITFKTVGKAFALPTVKTGGTTP